MTNCLCCNNQLLRHIRGHNVYLFCRSCRQEMPAVELKNCRLSVASRLASVTRLELTLSK